MSVFLVVSLCQDIIAVYQKMKMANFGFKTSGKTYMATLVRWFWSEKFRFL